jgi:hypothetical protein
MGRESLPERAQRGPLSGSNRRPMNWNKAFLRVGNALGMVGNLLFHACYGNHTKKG